MKFAIDPQPVHTYDPDKAKSYLKKAGMENLKVDFSVSDAAFSGGVDAGLLIQESAKAAGIDINLIREPADGYWDNVWLKKPWSLCYWGGRPVADMFMSVSLAADAAVERHALEQRPLQRAARWRPVRKRTMPSVRPCMPKPSSWSTTTAARSC